MEWKDQVERDLGGSHLLRSQLLSPEIITGKIMTRLITIYPCRIYEHFLLSVTDMASRLCLLLTLWAPDAFSTKAVKALPFPSNKYLHLSRREVTTAVGIVLLPFWLRFEKGSIR